MFKLVILGLLVTLTGCTGPLLTQDVDKVELIRVSYNATKYSRRSISLTNLQAPAFTQLISVIHDTKVKTYHHPGEGRSQESDPRYQLAIRYANGNVDYIDATETGQYLYRIVGKGKKSLALTMCRT